MTRRIPIIALGLALLTALPALACEGRVANAALDLTYTPFAPTAAQKRFEVLVEASCDWRLAVVPETHAPSRIDEQIAYDIRDDRGMSVIVPDLDDRTGGVEGVQARRMVDLSLRLDPDQGPPARRYTETLPLRLYDAKTGMVLDEAVLRIGVAVPQHLELSLAGANVDISQKFPDRPVLYKLIDFGDLEAGESRDLSILIRSNVDNSLRLKSLNQGAMMHRNAQVRSSIRYGVDLGDHAVDLRTDFTSQHIEATDAHGTAVPMKITIGEVSQAVAGSYADTIEITLDTAF